MSIEELKTKLAEIDNLVEAKTITLERAEKWKKRVIWDFEDHELPAEPQSTDLKHMPGRMVAGIIKGFGALAQNSGNRMGQLIEEDKKKEHKSVIDLYNDMENK